MNEMVDRVARAIAEHQHLAWLYDERTAALCDPEKLTITRAGLRAAARASIEAMREPTPEMLIAAGKETNLLTVGRVWQAMFDTALEKTPA